MCVCGGFKLAYPDMQLDPVVMRAKGMLLIRDSVRQMDTIGSSGTVEKRIDRPARLMDSLHRHCDGCLAYCDGQDSYGSYLSGRPNATFDGTVRTGSGPQ